LDCREQHHFELSVCRLCNVAACDGCLDIHEASYDSDYQWPLICCHAPDCPGKAGARRDFLYCVRCWSRELQVCDICDSKSRGEVLSCHVYCQGCSPRNLKLTRSGERACRECMTPEMEMPAAEAAEAERARANARASRADDDDVPLPHAARAAAGRDVLAATRAELAATRAISRELALELGRAHARMDALRLDASAAQRGARAADARAAMLRDAVGVKRERLEEATASAAAATADVAAATADAAAARAAAASAASALERARECCVCMTAPRSMVLVPCCHFAVCEACCAVLAQQAHDKLSIAQHRSRGATAPPLPECPICCQQAESVIGPVFCA
jgi:hypothetical protein